MKLNKCSRCGCFFMTDSDVCPNCMPKDMCDINKLKNFLDDDFHMKSSIEDISYETGISTKNLHRLLGSDQIANYDFSNSGNFPKMEL